MDLFCVTDIQDMQEKHIVICLQSNAKEKQESCKEHDEQHTTAEVLVWLRSAVTPGVLKTSYKCKVDTSGFILSSKLKGCPMPPAAPNTATLNPGAAPCALVGSLSNPPILSPCGGQEEDNMWDEMRARRIWAFVPDRCSISTFSSWVVEKDLLESQCWDGIWR
jgi:hypothetical protein